MNSKLRCVIWQTGFCISILIAPALSFAQVRGYSPVIEDSVKLAGLFQKYQKQYKEDLDLLPTKNKKDLVEIYQRRWKNIEEKFDTKEIYTDAFAQEYLNRLVTIIRQGNPSLSSANISCYFSRSYIPNAAYIGEGIILFNMGLFERLDNEGQAAFVLCHEMAHYLLHHSENGMRQYVDAINSEEVQEALRKIKGSAYRKNEQLQSLVKGLTFDTRRHSRDHEAEADSMAVELMRNTPFALSCAGTALALLDNIDRDSMNMSGYLPKIFNAPDYPFRKKWIMHDEGLLGGHAVIKVEEMTDSLKTHPDCKKRIILVNNLMKGWTQPVAGTFVVDSASFVTLRNSFRYESIEYAYFSENYSESLFLTLSLLEANPNDPYLVTQVGKLLNGLYVAQKMHTLSKKADLPSPGYPPDYNILLQFIQNLYLEDLASISYNYLKQFHPLMDPYPSFPLVYQESQKLVKN
jgi:Zn-dependent protease with chaperone function